MSLSTDQGLWMWHKFNPSDPKHGWPSVRVSNQLISPCCILLAVGSCISNNVESCVSDGLWPENHQPSHIQSHCSLNTQRNRDENKKTNKRTIWNKLDVWNHHHQTEGDISKKEIWTEVDPPWCQSALRSVCQGLPWPQSTLCSPVLFSVDLVHSALRSVCRVSVCVFVYAYINIYLHSIYTIEEYTVYYIQTHVALYKVHKLFLSFFLSLSIHAVYIYIYM